MIDFIKTQISGPSVEELLKHPLLDFHTDLNVKTGEVNTDTQTAEYRSLKFIIKGGKYINLQGSLHKFNTNGINYNDFSINGIWKSLHELSFIFNVDLKKSIIHNLEYGVNIKLRSSPQALVKCLLNYKGDVFQPMYGKAKRTGRISEKQQYIVKVYNKGWQCGLSEPLLRFEIKVVRMKYLEKYNIRILEDITDQGKLKLLMDDLVKVFKEILMYDSMINLNDCSKAKRRLLKEGRYSEYWTDLKKEDKKKHDYYRRRFRELTKEHGQNTQGLISVLIMNKANHLLLLDSNTLVNLTNKEMQVEVSNCEKSLAELTKPQIQELYDNNHSSSMVKSPAIPTISENKLCDACGRKILGRKATALYCSEQCRIKSKNRRRDLRLPLKRFAKKQKEMPSLFDVKKYTVLSREQQSIVNRYSIQFE